MEDIELYKKHKERRGEDALTLSQFVNNRINCHTKYYTNEEAINKPPQGYYTKYYNKHKEKRGSNATCKRVFRTRITKHGWGIDRAINTPSKHGNRKLAMGLKYIRKRLKNNNLYNKSYSMFTVEVKGGKIDLLKVAKPEEISKLGLYKSYRKKFLYN